MFCKNSIGTSATYRLIGLDDGSIERRRAVYYLYPNIEKQDPDFLLVYKKSDASREGYSVFRMLDPERYILKKVRE